jgi:N-acetylglucosaminyldiphosphoundecaprenol N-acetyl-beta-D-mannosaminyltransferase
MSRSDTRDFPAQGPFRLAESPMPLSIRQTEQLPEPTDPPALPPTAEILGIPLALSDYERTMDWMDAMVAARAKGYVTAAAVHLVMVAQEERETREAVLGATLAVPDGQPLVWALRALGREANRVYGPDLMDLYCARSASTGVTMFLYGGRNQGALIQLALELRKKHPGLKIVGGYSPPYREPTQEEEDWVVKEINRSKADVVWVGTGQPKQEKWMARMREKLDAPLLVGVGAAFDFHAGLVPQAPVWMQKLGLEWTFRLAQEPRRLWRRYARYNPRFVAGFLRQYRAANRR